MVDRQERFNDGASYEQMMGGWSRLVGPVFLDWVAPQPGLRWIDIGCGNGAFTELVVQRCGPLEVKGIDPSDGQLAFARARPSTRKVEFCRGDAMALPFSNNRFDAAVMALAISFIDHPTRGVAEMTRVVCPGGTVASYAWDTLGGGFPVEPIHAELRHLGVVHSGGPNVGASRLQSLRDLWVGGGLDAVETRKIEVKRSFERFEDFWSTSLMSSVGRPIAEMAPSDVELLKMRVRKPLPADPEGRITCTARANAVKGRVPK
jgi:SAM-dependent methyltransferase